MEGRHKIRELALQVLFAFDAQQDASRTLADEVTRGAGGPGGVMQENVVQEVTTLATNVWDNRKTADAWAERLAPQWPSHRQPGVDRAILRLAIYELTTLDTPPKVVIDEAIELAKQFSTANSSAFVNGVLDAVLKEIVALRGQGLGAKGQ